MGAIVDKALSIFKKEKETEKAKVQAERELMYVFELQYDYYINGKGNKLYGATVNILAHAWEHATELLTTKLGQRSGKLHNILSYCNRGRVDFISDAIIKKVVECNVESVKLENMRTMADSQNNARLFKMETVSKQNIKNLNPV